MQALRNFRSITRLLSLLALAVAFSSCATKRDAPLISDGAQRESSIPWNEQKKWEQQGTLGPMAERFGGGQR